MDRVGWTNFSSLFDGLDQFIPTQASPHTPTDLGLALRRFDSEGPHLSYAGANDVGEEAQPGRPRRNIRAPSCGTGWRLGHGGHQH
ncbi:hypothetical protein Ahy_A03g010852 isoform B [Arachis hypogaea]|uniref:Uncharacterized protein n=1 Tax=Arachis hypogaea TaxID=3818 RepID=A0A445DNR3_ARAHY|nr:hypothetical protein Ahy_A03g010852 isoform B [Arachis hypogaea]